MLAGATAATGSHRAGRGGVAPLRFLRELGCVDARLAPLHTPECRHFRPLRADGWAHHPYSRLTTPGASDPDPDDAPLADTGRLEGLLAALAARGRIARRLALYQTEYGYETNPPDPTAPFGTLDQARFVGWSTYLAWRDPGTRMFAQFLLRDIDSWDTVRGGGPRWGDFQTGLFFSDDKPKPAAAAFRMPFWAEAQDNAGQRSVLLFGGFRPARGPVALRVERQDPGNGTWQPVEVSGERCDGPGPAFVTDPSGWFLRSAPYQGAADYRLSRLLPDGGWEPGVGVSVSEGSPRASPS